MSDNRVLGVPIDGTDWSQIKGRLDNGESLWIVTANPEILLEARKDEKYRKVISSADIRTVDGFGLFLVSMILRRKVRRVTGVELGEHAVQYAWKHGLRLAFFGGEAGEAGIAAKHVRDAYPDVQVHAEQPGVIGRDGSEDLPSEEAHHRLVMYSPEVLLVAFGHPRQEEWIEKHRKAFPDLKLVIGIGGTFNFWAGRIRRAPAWMRSIGLEWLWRLIQEPHRIGRIFRAVVVFPILALFDAIR